MPLDGFTISAVAHEMQEKILGGRVDKIYQPENDELIFHIRSQGEALRLLLTANASHPRVHLTEKGKNNPPQPPMFCMVLRKHLTGGRIVSVDQPSFERIVSLSIESLNELGDLSLKKVVIEMMGKHSNIFLLRDDFYIIDAVKHISAAQSSVRQVQPGYQYIDPPGGKDDPTQVRLDSFLAMLENKKGMKIQSTLFSSYNGLSPLASGDICVSAGLDPGIYPEELDDGQKSDLYHALTRRLQETKHCILYLTDAGQPKDFACIPILQYAPLAQRAFDSPSRLLEAFYEERDQKYRLSQKTSDLRRLIQTHIDRCVKKQNIYFQTLKDIEDRDQERIKGELLTANIFSLQKGMTKFSAYNYYDGAILDIALDPTLTPSENAQKYFKRYNKGKRAFAALQDQIQKNHDDLDYLESVLISAVSVADEAEIAEIREELTQTGFAKARVTRKSIKAKKTQPLHYVSSDGFDIYVGKNNRQNDELTLRFASSGDIWLHTKEIPGSHVIIKANGKVISDIAIREAAHLAAFYSKARNSAQVPIDYTLKKNVKKPNGAKPGMVIYVNHKTIYMTPQEDVIKNWRSVNS